MDKVLESIRPFVGTWGLGGFLVGPHCPFGMARPGPDNVPPNATSGYTGPKKVYRFSQTHVAGTGGGGRYGNLGLWPFLGSITANPLPSHLIEETAEPGYYRARIADAPIGVELTASPFCALHRYTFGGLEAPRLLVDLGSVIWKQEPSMEQYPRSTGGYARQLDDRTVIGRADVVGGWGHNQPYSIHFALECDAIITWLTVARGERLLPGREVQGPDSRLVLSFDAREVTVRMGLSFVSVAQAREHLGVAAEKDGVFAGVRNTTKAAWAEILRALRVDGPAENGIRELFHTALYRLHCMPTDLGVGGNPLWNSGKRQFTDLYCLWDSVRGANQLLHLLHPSLHRDLLTFLLDMAEHEGWMADAWIAGHAGMAQGGCQADILFAEAKLKGLEGIDYGRALQACRKNAEVTPPDPWRVGRDGLELRKQHGYLPAGVQSCVSKQIEYCAQDYGISTLAGALGEADLASAYARRAEELWNLWHPQRQCFYPKDAQGRFTEDFEPDAMRFLDPLWRSDRYYYEGTPAMWTLAAPHALEGLIERLGGPDGFEAYLDRFFAERLVFWKEINMPTPFFYNLTKAPYKSALTARRILAEKYRPERDGWPDNDDMGAHSAFIVWTVLGLYPRIGTDRYFVAAPMVRRTYFHPHGSSQETVIECPSAAPENVAVKAVALDGKPLDRLWLTHAELSGVDRIRIDVEPVPEVSPS